MRKTLSIVAGLISIGSLCTAATATGYGRYYAAGFNFSNGNMDPATLWTVWSNVNGSWKVVSYALLSP